MKIPVPVAGIVAEILRPVRRVADLAVGPDDRAHILRQRPKRLHGRKAVTRPADLRETTKLGADAERLDAARSRAKMRVMQDHAAQRPFLRPVIAHRAVLDGEIPRLRLPEKRRDLLLRLGGAVRRAVAPRCNGGGDPPAPRQRRLLVGIAPRVRQPVALELFHQQERIEQHLLPAGMDRRNPLDDSRIRRRAAINGPVVELGDLPRVTTAQPRDPPRHPDPVELSLLDLGPKPAFPRAQIVAEPGHHHRHGLAARQLGAKRRDRRRHVRCAGGAVDVDRLLLAGAEIVMHRRRRQRIFPGSRDQRDPAQRLRQGQHSRRIRRAQHLEAQLRHPVAEATQRQILEHDIGRTAIGGDHPLPLDSLHLRVRELIVAAGVDPHLQVILCDLLAIGPDPSDPEDLALAQREREADRIAELRHLRLRRALAAPRGGAVLAKP